MLRVLLVEDSENDCELILRELRRGGYAVKFERVQTAAGMHAALIRQEWDLVICDYVMPGFTGLDALAVFKQRQLDTPFIIVSGQIGEEVAVDSMKAGAHDYVMKDRLARLVPVVTRELREAAARQAHRKADHVLRESEERFRQLAENIDAVFFISERPDGARLGRMLYVSPAYEKVWGRSANALYEDPQAWLDAIHPLDRKNVQARLPQMERGEFNHQFRILAFDAEERWIQYRAFPVFNEQGAVYRVAAIAEDITARKRVEDQLATNAETVEETEQGLREAAGNGASSRD